MANELIDISAVVICRECRKMYTTHSIIDDVMPCGHRPDVWSTASNIIDELESARLVDWADRNGHLNLVLEELELDGGSFAYGYAGANFIEPTEPISKNKRMG